jgi:hypothetical protein
MIFGQRHFFMDPKGGLKRIPKKTIVIKGVNGNIDKQNRRQLTDHIRIGEQIIAK